MFGIHKAILLMSLAGAAAQEKMPNCLKSLWGKQELRPANSIGVIKLVGEVDKSAESVIKKVLAFCEDKNINGVLLVVNSGGGGSGVSELVFREVKALADNKPVVALATDICFSGAYKVATGAHWIIAPRAAGVGSIGTIHTIGKHKNVRLNRNGFKADVEYEILHGGKYKVLSHANSASLTKEERALVQSNVDAAYKVFYTTVAQQRKLPLNKVAEWAEGKVFTGEQALEKGLIDQVGGYSDAVKKLKELMKERGHVVDGKVTFVE